MKKYLLGLLALASVVQADTMVDGARFQTGFNVGVNVGMSRPTGYLSYNDDGEMGSDAYFDLDGTEGAIGWYRAGSGTAPYGSGSWVNAGMSMGYQCIRNDGFMMGISMGLGYDSSRLIRSLNDYSDDIDTVENFYWGAGNLVANGGFTFDLVPQVGFLITPKMLAYMGFGYTFGVNRLKGTQDLFDLNDANELIVSDEKNTFTHSRVGHGFLGRVGFDYLVNTNFSLGFALNWSVFPSTKLLDYNTKTGDALIAYVVEGSDDDGNVSLDNVDDNGSFKLEKSLWSLSFNAKYQIPTCPR